MRTEVDLDAAAAAGLIGEDQAIALRTFQAERDGISAASSEKFQLFGGYADLVIGIGTAMVLTAVSIFMVNLGDTRSTWPVLATLCAITCAIVFTLTRRINLRSAPAMALVLTVAFAGFSLFGFMIVATSLAEAVLSHRSHYIFAVFLIIIAAHSALIRIHWRAFRFPPTIAMMSAAYAFVILTSMSQIVGHQGQWIVAATALAIATATMIAATWWDLTDIRRETERSQVAFWLHCLAGVLMSRALFWLLTGTGMKDGQLILTGLPLENLPYVLLMVAVAAIISLLLDRRSLLVGCLVPTVGIFDRIGDGAMAAVMGLTVAGASLIFFSVTWAHLRTRLLAMIPDMLAAQLPRTSLIAEGQRPTRRHKELWRLR